MPATQDAGCPSEAHGQRLGPALRVRPGSRRGEPARDQKPGGGADCHLGHSERDEARGRRTGHGAEDEEPIAGQQQPAKPNSPTDEHDHERGDAADESHQRPQLAGGGRRDAEVARHVRKDRTQGQEARLRGEQAGEFGVARRYRRAHPTPGTAASKPRELRLSRLGQGVAEGGNHHRDLTPPPGASPGDS
jgi:hypothetical protein